MQKFLFQHFLTDKKAYALNQHFWDRQLARLVSPMDILQRHWINNKYANGKKIYDGNPIYSALLQPNKAIRVIQEQPESREPSIGAWIENTENREGKLVEELIISLELSDVTRDIAFQLIEQWAKKGLQAHEIDKIMSKLPFKN